MPIFTILRQERRIQKTLDPSGEIEVEIVKVSFQPIRSPDGKAFRIYAGSAAEAWKHLQEFSAGEIPPLSSRLWALEPYHLHHDRIPSPH